MNLPLRKILFFVLKFKFKLNKDILEKYFVIKETKRKDFLVYELLLNVNAPVDKEHSDKIGKLNINSLGIKKEENSNGEP